MGRVSMRAILANKAKAIHVAPARAGERLAKVAKDTKA